MNISPSDRSFLFRLQVILLPAVLFSLSPSLNAATYKVGDVVSDFTLIARRPFTGADGNLVPAGAEVRLKDFQGAVVFLEWFAVWCPYCVAAAPQVDAGIAEYYESRGGNPHGVPVIHVAVNQEAKSFYQKQTDAFIDQQGFKITVNDYDATSVNRVRFMFQPIGQPVFAVINGVTNAVAHKPWEVLVNHLGYGDTEFTAELNAFRSAIDAVQPAPPPLELVAPVLAEGALEFVIPTRSGQSYRVQAASDLAGWETIAELQGSGEPLRFRDVSPPISARFYRVLTP